MSGEQGCMLLLLRLSKNNKNKTTVPVFSIFLQLFLFFLILSWGYAIFVFFIVLNWQFFFSLPCQTSPWVWGKLDPFLGCGRWGWEFSIFVQVFLGGRVKYSTIQFVCRLPLREISDLLLAATDGGHIEIILYLGKGQKASQQASSLANLKREAVSPVRDRVVISTIQFESHW